MPEPGVPEEKIDESETTKSDDDFERDSDEVARETVTETFNEEASSVEETRARIEAISESLVKDTDSEIEMDAKDATYDDAASDDEGSDTDTEESGMRRRTREYRENEVGTQNRKGRRFARAKGISLLLGIASTASGAASLILAIYLASKDGGAGSGGGGLTDAQGKLLTDQIKKWQDTPDSDMWDAVANYMDSWNPSWQGQLLMMDTIKQLATPLTKTWVWRDSDAALWARRLVDVYGANTTPPAGKNRARVIYETVKTMSYTVDNKGTLVALPRQIAADLVELAITDIVTRTNT
jgi:hypothetical protein